MKRTKWVLNTAAFDKWEQKTGYNRNGDTPMSQLYTAAGVTRQGLNLAIRQKRLLSIDKMLALAEAMNCPIEELIKKTA